MSLLSLLSQPLQPPTSRSSPGPAASRLFHYSSITARIPLLYPPRSTPISYCSTSNLTSGITATSRTDTTTSSSITPNNHLQILHYHHHMSLLYILLKFSSPSSLPFEEILSSLVTPLAVPCLLTPSCSMTPWPPTDPSGSTHPHMEHTGGWYHTFLAVTSDLFKFAPQVHKFKSASHVIWGVLVRWYFLVYLIGWENDGNKKQRS